jgi:hypothetical protein
MRWGLAALLSAAFFAAVLGGSPGAVAAPQDPAAQSPDVRPTRASTRIYVTPQRPGPNSRRICQSWLAQEYRPSGTVITPQMRCWWD